MHSRRELEQKLLADATEAWGQDGANAAPLPAPMSAPAVAPHGLGATPYRFGVPTTPHSAPQQAMRTLQSNALHRRPIKRLSAVDQFVQRRQQRGPHTAPRSSAAAMPTSPGSPSVPVSGPEALHNWRAARSLLWRAAAQQPTSAAGMQHGRRHSRTRRRTRGSGSGTDSSDAATRHARRQLGNTESRARD